MPTERVLIAIESAFGAAGFNKAQLAMLGLSGSALALGGVLGGVVLVSKSMIEIAAKHEEAEKSLAQAVEAANMTYGKNKTVLVDVTKETRAHDAAVRHLAEVQAGMPTKHKATTLQLMHLQDAQKLVRETAEDLTKAQAQNLPVINKNIIYLAGYREQINQFIRSNREYISDQSEVITNYAKLTRTGLAVSEVQRVMTDAVNLSSLKHISLSEAVDLLNAAEHGRMRGLIDLGVTTAKYTDANGNLIQSQHSVAQSMTEVEAAIQKGKDAKTEDEKATLALGNDWQTFAQGPGAELGRAFTNAKQIGDLFLQMLFAMGHNNPLWDAIQNKLIGLAQWVDQYIIKPWREVIDWYGRLPSPTSLPPAGTPGRYGRQGGGYVWPGNTYTVGESRPEGLTMFPGGGGYVSSSAPSSSGGGGRGGSMTVNVYGYVGDNRQLALTIRESLRRLDREQR